MNDENELLEINPAYKNYPTKEHGWIYIAIDMRDLRFSKIGLTTKELPSRRIAEGRTYNPFLTLFTTYELARCTFGISQRELSDIEAYIHGRSVFGYPLKHLDSGRDSEWFQIRPDYAEGQVDWILAKRNFSVDHEKLFEYYDGPNNRNGVNVRAMRKIKKVYRPAPGDMERLAQSAGYDARLISPYLDYLEKFHAQGHPDQVWL
ncbi:GIY-YIG nuclease family protein [Burkholderia stagnalis]|nr:GIY-YIG nuclease family protein [Burkholderia stagnalis]RQX94940.1 GIY-YIG nuclease family protein [Burkholderia stagnalis]RQY11310.1 GIY-YIG nuclease family protein [Burkholderia stagnalis]RQY27428.1 GIY-YIG nuclease family protein [Burkholderia stagnalis]